MLLADGRVLVTVATEAQLTNWAEIYDPATDRWTPTSIQRDGGVGGTVLADGRVLLTGYQCDRSGPQIYDPRTDTVSTASAMPALNGGGYAATLLRNGKVLLAGGYGGPQDVGTQPRNVTQLYDPGTNSWTLAAPLLTHRLSPQSIRLADGRVLVAGGSAAGSGPLPYLRSAEIYDPVANAWASAGEITADGYQSSAVAALGDGMALAAGGGEDGRPTSGAEVFDPSTRTWSKTGSMTYARSGALAMTLADGGALVVGGQGISGAPLTSAERFDPASGNWTVMPSGLKTGSLDASAILLKDGRVFVAAWPDLVFGQSSTADAQVFDPKATTSAATPGTSPDASRTWAAMPDAAGLFGNYSAHGAGFTSTAAAAVLKDGRVMLVGTNPTNEFHTLTATDGVIAAIYDPARGQSRMLAVPQTISSIGATTTLLRSGKVLVVGDGAELYDPASDTWAAAGSVLVKRFGHTATLLADGRVLVAGGLGPPQENGGGDSPLTSTEIYDPRSNQWAGAAEMPSNLGDSGNTATRLRDGRVLVVGGGSALYDPKLDRWSAVSGHSSPPQAPQTATLLADGKVLVLEGCVVPTYASCARYGEPQLFDPATSRWSPAAPMPRGREGFNATLLLRNGLVLVAGGMGPAWVVASADLYDPSADRWSTTSDMHVARAGPVATLLKNGAVLVIGGSFLGNMSSAELYTPFGGGQAPASANSSSGLAVGLAVPILSAAALLAALMLVLSARRRFRR